MSWKRRCRRKRARSIWMRRASKPAVRSRAGTLANRRPYRTRTGAVGGSHQPQTKDTRTARRAASGPSIVSLEGPPSDQHWRACALRRRDPLSTRDRSRSEVTRVAAGQALSARPSYRVQDREYNSQDSGSPGQDPGVPSSAELRHVGVADVPLVFQRARGNVRATIVAFPSPRKD